MTEQDVETLHNLLQSHKRRVSLLNELESADIITISSGSADGSKPLISLGKNSPLRPLVIDAVKKCILNIETEVANIAPELVIADKVSQ